MTVCKYCGEDNFEWFETPWGYHLFSPDRTLDGQRCYVQHRCSERENYEKKEREEKAKQYNKQFKGYDGPETSDRVAGQSMFIEDRVGKLKICDLVTGSKRNKFIAKKYVANPKKGEIVKISNWDGYSLTPERFKNLDRLWKIVKIYD